MSGSHRLIDAPHDDRRCGGAPQGDPAATGGLGVVLLKTEGYRDGGLHGFPVSGGNCAGVTDMPTTLLAMRVRTSWFWSISDWMNLCGSRRVSGTVVAAFGVPRKSWLLLTR